MRFADSDLPRTAKFNSRKEISSFVNVELSGPEMNP